jgi:MerR family mercuric resistance operon transcriptional regulator
MLACATSLNFAAVDGELVSCERVKYMADAHRSDIRSKIADLRKMERTLRELSDQCSGEDVPECPIIEALQTR